MGNYASAFKGQGLEFADYRYYSPSDDANRIDWKASSRARKLLVKEFMEERNLNVVFLLDVSSKMVLGSVARLKCEYAAELVASFATTILRAGDFAGLSLFSEKVVKNVSPSNGMRHYQLISDALSDVSYYGGGSSIKMALKHAIENNEPNSLVILISDFVGEQNFLDELRLAGKKFDLIGIMIRDPIDMQLPEGSGQARLEDPSTGEVMLISPKSFRDVYAKETKREVSNLVKMFRVSGADFLPLYTNKAFVEDLIEFFQRRKMGWR
jgi:uncharacterized protein (DUF58 family)